MSTGCGSAWRWVKDFMEEGGTYSVLSVLFDGGKWYLWFIRCVVGSFVEGIFSSGGGMGKMDGLCVWVEIWIEFLIFCLAGCFVMGG